MSNRVLSQKVFIDELITTIRNGGLVPVNYEQLISEHRDRTDALNNELTLRIEGLKTDLIPASTHSIPFSNGEIIFLARYIVLMGDHTEGYFVFYRAEDCESPEEVQFITSSYQLPHLLLELALTLKKHGTSESVDILTYWNGPVYPLKDLNKEDIKLSTYEF
ncbi:hypothetical protein [Paenibacillus kribbensis]|uniref:hypothetical protein n=1 Tax=Paenibacillus kribbensis TaxID=172713 RepID=UPI000838E3C7|nr:hypothetical protein [Paenibacillus kribbensis]